MYSSFSWVYNSLMGDVNYNARTEYISALFKKFDRMPTLLLDLACGTGGFSNCFANKGVSVIGVDIIPEMLSVARESINGRDILYLCQNAAELDLYGTVDGVICCMDSINHITDYNELCETFKKVSLFLEKDRLFIFDVNTLYKHEQVLGNNTFVIDEDDIYCVWDNTYDSDNKITAINLDFFRTLDGENYIRTEDYIEERAYTDEELESALKNAGFEILAVYAEMDESPIKPDTERAFYVARKVK